MDMIRMEATNDAYLVPLLKSETYTLRLKSNMKKKFLLQLS